MSPVGHLVGLSVLVPVEIGARVIRQVPAVADRVRREIVLARFIGKLAVEHGVEELRERLHGDGPRAPEQRVSRPAGPASPAGDHEGDHDEVDEANGDDGTRDKLVGGAAEPAIVRSDPGTLALADYEHLSSAQIVAKLDGLERREREAIERYERAGRHRRTILGKLDQLRSEP